jgi:hypothetical protein
VTVAAIVAVSSVGISTLDTPLMVDQVATSRISALMPFTYQSVGDDDGVDEAARGGRDVGDDIGDGRVDGGAGLVAAIDQHVRGPAPASAKRQQEAVAMALPVHAYFDS